MKAADSFDRHDSAIMDHLPCIRDGISAPLGSADQIHLWTTCIAAHRLRIITPCLRIVIFLCTIRTHRKLFHTGAFPVIRQRIQNRHPRSATGTVNKRMQIPPILWIVHFLFALVTDCNIRGNKYLPFRFLTLDNVKCPKLRCIPCRNIFCIYFQNSRTLRRTFLKVFEKSIDLRPGTLCVNFYIWSLVTDISMNPIRHSMAAHRWSETNPLHDTVYPDPLRNLAHTPFSPDLISVVPTPQNARYPRIFRQTSVSSVPCSDLHRSHQNHHSLPVRYNHPHHADADRHPVEAPASS